VRVLIKVGRSCNNDCTFCHASDRRRGTEPRSSLEHKIRRAHERSASMVILSGGEPTLHPDLLALADCVAGLGMHLGLVTNGRRLADASLVDELLRRNLRYAYVSLHGASAPVHDTIVRAQAFEQTLSAIRNLSGRVEDLTVNTVVTRDNLLDLRGIVELLEGFPGLLVKFTFPQPKGAALDHFDSVVPRLTDAASAVMDTIAHATARGASVRFGLEGFPFCLVPGFSSLRDDLETHDIRSMVEPEDDDLVAVDSSLSIKTSRCDGCSVRSECPGIYREYARHRGDSELAARTQRSDVDAEALHVVEVREQAAHERRRWVRVTWACNNRCRFCLDRDTGRTEMRPDDEIKRDIVEGRREGAERLILSGGEPTTHPRFASLVRFGKRAGYRWVQSITNGRMLSYPRFLAGVIQAGLDEVTVSMHGHTPSLHDELVGVAGAFDQASQGIRSALASKSLVVNIDIVINAHNVDHLPDMLRTFVSWGVREFDLLHLIPFGGAWEVSNGDLFYDLAEHADPIRRALAFCRDEGVQLWLNRFPPEHAEGFEFLIQDPHKLHDEVRGRAASFETFVAGGPHLPCRAPERCKRCYLQGLCDAFERVRDLSRARSVPALRVHAFTSPEVLALLPAADLLEVVAPDPAQAVVVASALRAQALRLRLDRLEGLASMIDSDGHVAGIPLHEVVVSRPDQLEAALACRGVDVVVPLCRDMAPLLSALGPHADRIVFEQPTHDRLTVATREDVDLRNLFDTLGFVVRTRGIAPCLSGREPLPRPEVLDASVLRSDGSVDPQGMTSLYVRELFRAKSLRCGACAWAAQCPGMHLNWLRAHGFGALDPTTAKEG
jgi:MoaA/NifB/PqqE/SkfB family radical SAM enzyme